MTVVQRTSGGMRLNPHLRVVFLDGAYHEDGTELVWNELGHLRTGEVGQVLEHAVGRMLRYLRRHGHLEIEHDVEEDDEPEAALCASAVSGRHAGSRIVAEQSGDGRGPAPTPLNAALRRSPASHVLPRARRYPRAGRLELTPAM
ncbi:hypothetical protein WMF04_10940 [Sorangium sp. So ce260]|uniref:hypothetical protein n=1 Tax=Sorangium sp. So ce260 TaxID=3133291 RepID=UPI003F5EB4AA